MSIKAKYAGLCSLCSKRWGPGAHIGRWLGAEVHFSCRQNEIARRAAEGEAEQLPDARGWADKPARMMLGRHRRWRPADIGRISEQDGRSQDGRYQSKPDPS
jgi:hypothetical protein